MDFNAKPINVKPFLTKPYWENSKMDFLNRPPSTHKRVFRKGRRIKTMAALDKHLASGGWIFWAKQNRAVHPGWVMSWQYQMVKNSLAWGIWKAVRI
jgi:hypothetical protein